MNQCPICSSIEFKIVYKLSHYTIIRCVRCGLVRRNEEIKAEVQRALYCGEEYFTNNPERKSADYVSEWQWEFDQKRFEQEIREISKFKLLGKLLDVGAATGNFLQIAQDKGFDVVGVEFSPFASQYARKRGFSVYTGTVEHAPLLEEEFDVVTMHHVLEHVPDLMGMLSTIHRTLKRGGLLVIEVPNFASFRSKVNGPQWEDLRPEEHLYYFEPKTLSILLQECHFQVLLTKTKSEVLWILQEPLRLLWLPDRVIYRLKPGLRKLQTTQRGTGQPQRRSRLGRQLLLKFTWLMFSPLASLYELLGLEKRLVAFATKVN